jgi:hypothetical protein
MATPTVRDVHVDTAMTGISIGYSNAEYIGEQVFPRVPVAHKSDYYYIFSPGAWFRDEVKQRAPGTRAAKADYTISTASYVAIQYAIGHDVPDEVRKNADAVLQPSIEATEFVTDALLRSQERRIAAKVMSSTLWKYGACPSDTSGWDADTSDPFGDIEAAVNSVVSNVGRLPNTFVTSWDVWRRLRNHPDLLDRIKFTRPGGKVEPSDITNWFGIPKILVGTSLYDSANEGATAALTYIWGDGVWIGFVPPAPGLRIPASGYLLEFETRAVNQYRNDQEHSDTFEALHSTAEVISCSEAGAYIIDCV